MSTKFVNRLPIAIACFTALSVSAWAREQATGDNVKVAVKNSITESISKTDANTTIINDANTPRNPFKYSVPGGRNGFLPTSLESIPPGIKVLAIMIVQGMEPLAVLQVPGMTEVLYVKPGDIIGIEIQKTQKTQKNISTSGNRNRNNTINRIVYVKIENIDSQQVELYPQTNPAGKQIIR